MDFKRILLERIFLVAITILIIGIVIIYVFPPYHLVGEILISGGFFGILIELFLGSHEKFVLRREILGIGDKDTLITKLLEMERGNYTQYERRSFWKLIEVGDPMWASEHYEEADVVIGKENIGNINFFRGTALADLSEMKPEVIIIDRGKERPPTRVTPMTEISVGGTMYFKIEYPFRAEANYTLKIRTVFPPHMKKDKDYLRFVPRVDTARHKVTIEFPPEVTCEDYKFTSYVLNTRFERVRELDIIESEKVKNQCILEEEGYEKYIGPLKGGDAILFFYERKD